MTSYRRVSPMRRALFLNRLLPSTKGNTNGNSHPRGYATETWCMRIQNYLYGQNLFGLAGKLITEAHDGDQELRISWIALKLLSQPQHVYIHGTSQRNSIIAPHVAKKFLT
jgi:hypothetical protein